MTKHHNPTRQHKPAGKECGRFQYSSRPYHPQLAGRESPSLIDTPAIRIQLNSLKTKQNVFSNRHSSRGKNLHEIAAHRTRIRTLHLSKAAAGQLGPVASSDEPSAPRLPQASKALRTARRKSSGATNGSRPIQLRLSSRFEKSLRFAAALHRIGSLFQR